MELKARLTDLLQRAYDEEQALVARLTEDERSATGSLERWSAKDIVAHLVEWKARTGQKLAAAARNEPPRTYDDIDQANAEIFEEHRHQTWAEVLEKSQRAHEELVERLRAIPEDDLVDPSRFPWQSGRPLWREIAGNGYSHPLLHIAQFYVERGEREYATQTQETAAHLLRALDDSPSWHGIILYNLACYYATAGQKEKAIDELRQALRLNPDLTQWSQQDPDFASIREEPAYHSLYSG
jgi:tetratricopeptide (TPR) repeat protein